MIGCKICGISDPKTLTYIVDHPHPPQFVGFIVNWKALENQSLDETINALAMASPFTLEEKQALLEAQSLDVRKTKIAKILNTYSFDQYNNTTIQ